ncbi:MAG: hypothetical protein HWE21_13130 [Cytophagia bacterium]|nr:hypothetical protein [Cytophagia bacterium]
MTLSELLDHDDLKLPKSWRRDGYRSYQESINGYGSKYLETLEALKEEDIKGIIELIGNVNKETLIQVATITLDTVKKCVDSYLNEGNPHKAYNEFAAGFMSNSDKSKSLQPNYMFAFQRIYPRLYRMRVGENLYNKSDLFHPPFQLRSKVPSYRYSISGFPSLYLSGNTFTAFKELDEPSYSNLFVSEFNLADLENRLYLLNLMSRPQANDFDTKFKFLAIWPLIMACNIMVANRDHPFKPEYILPQIVYQWSKIEYRIGGKEIVGVQYDSSKFLSSRNNVGAFFNVAIPVMKSGNHGYCSSLRRMFKLKRPLLFKDVLEYGMAPKYLTSKQVMIKGEQIDYLDTDFAKIEYHLNCCESDFLES